MSQLTPTLQSVQTALQDRDFHAAHNALQEACIQANSHGANSLASVLTHVLEILPCFGSSEDDTRKVEEITEFIDKTLPALQAALEDDLAAEETCLEAAEYARAEWGEYLDLLPADSGGGDWAADAWAGDEHTESPADDDLPLETAGIDMAALLSGLEAAAPQAQQLQQQEPVQPEAAAGTDGVATRPPLDRPDIEADLLEAYNDDATKCLASMEQCLLTIESDASNTAAMQQFCRELHTLKGASGSVGLSALAGYLHELEDYVESAHKKGEALEVDPLLAGVDAVREQLAHLGGSTEAVEHAPSPAAADNAVGRPANDQNSGNETSFVRVEAARLGKLLDLLAELVSLRNRRDTYVSSLRQVHGSVGGCVSRMRTLTERLSDGAGGSADESEQFARSASRHATYRARELSELCSDVAELNRTLRETFDPLGEDNDAVSRLIGEFRRELMDLQRVPVAGLFRRLHRGARDAARLEQKQVEIEFIGADVRLERSLQERLFEPLLHIVRNAVSHGIESSADRQAAGKETTGRITLAAHSNATSLVFEVRDDGGGLDYDRVERKGRERGLIPAGASPSRDRLARLIFHPGFSTQSEVSEVSGRGVGMDVVATQVHRLRGRVEINSEPGHGTGIQLQIPLRSAIEHAMVMRCCGQLFAVPMQFVQAARPEPEDLPRDLQVAGLEQLLNLRPTANAGRRQLVVLGHHATGRDGALGNLAIEVDGVVGAEEVVVRALPPLLMGHPLLSGLTLSGQGEAVLILDVARVMQLAVEGNSQASTAAMPVQPEQTHNRAPRVLVVDDSLSTRRTHVRLVQQAGLETEEASDGLEALKMLKSGRFQAVLTDLEMPRLGGSELVSEIKQRSRIGDIPVFVITSRGDEETHRRLLALGANQVVVKPLTHAVVSDLHDMLAEATRRELVTAGPATTLK